MSIKQRLQSGGLAMLWLWGLYGLMLALLYLLVFGERVGVGPWSGKDDYLLLLFVGMKLALGGEFFSSDTMSEGGDLVKVNRGWKAVLGIVGLAVVLDVVLMVVFWHGTIWALGWIGMGNSFWGFLAAVVAALILPTLVGYAGIRVGFTGESSEASA